MLRHGQHNAGHRPGRRIALGFAGSVVIDALKTHPLCIIGRVMRQNPFYMQPEAFLAELRRRHSG